VGNGASSSDKKEAWSAFFTYAFSMLKMIKRTTTGLMLLSDNIHSANTFAYFLKTENYYVLLYQTLLMNFPRYEGSNENIA
jgi:hypothetical protein